MCSTNLDRAVVVNLFLGNYIIVYWGCCINQIAHQSDNPILFNYFGYCWQEYNGLQFPIVVRYFLDFGITLDDSRDFGKIQSWKNMCQKGYNLLLQCLKNSYLSQKMILFCCVVFICFIFLGKCVNHMKLVRIIDNSSYKPTS